MHPFISSSFTVEYGPFQEADLGSNHDLFDVALVLTGIVQTVLALVTPIVNEDSLAQNFLHSRALIIDVTAEESNLTTLTALLLI
ncbi:hypothetical protein DAPPUDRAFT_248601 [Daphnia pulex]|uniref:Uncharacterized protein n=1 Tax=Daphnia pulex TaxID=6669 RepID=E9GUH3_DAPPU|nr:hypothetical protein DAPPUDRAFT_248601 [Daphnia pulex]|eukprot:EFX76831.1 hypothetical protein DAPPUDRAFT_248601 [Daphnia pulex]